MLDIENQSWEAIQRIFAPSAKNSAQECGDCGSGKGDKGDNGADGLSAYQIAIINGFAGTQQEWIASLQGAKGADGVRSVEYKGSTTIASGAYADIEVATGKITMLRFSHSWNGGTASIWSFISNNAGNQDSGVYFLEGMSSGGVTRSGNAGVANATANGQSVDSDSTSIAAGKPAIRFRNSNSYNASVTVYKYELDLGFT